MFEIQSSPEYRPGSSTNCGGQARSVLARLILLESAAFRSAVCALLGVGLLPLGRNRLGLLTLSRNSFDLLLQEPFDILFDDVSGYCIDLVGVLALARVELQDVARLARIAAQLLSGEDDFLRCFVQLCVLQGDLLRLFQADELGGRRNDLIPANWPQFASRLTKEGLQKLHNLLPSFQLPRTGIELMQIGLPSAVEGAPCGVGCHNQRAVAFFLHF